MPREHALELFVPGGEQIVPVDFLVSDFQREIPEHAAQRYAEAYAFFALENDAADQGLKELFLPFVRNARAEAVSDAELEQRFAYAAQRHGAGGDQRDRP